MTLACEGSATQALDATRCGSFDFARRLASLRMTLHSVIGLEPFEIQLRSYGQRSGLVAHSCRAKREDSYGRISGPKAGSRASSPGEQAAACDYQKTRALGRGLNSSPQLATAKTTRALGSARELPKNNSSWLI